ncbi:MAG: hypothetical protein H7326_07025 [Bdellovibrionaceae bacterium]|nr:hypothetical protein [Pseudobdellovibrionaceae bacterium]
MILMCSIYFATSAVHAERIQISPTLAIRTDLKVVAKEVLSSLRTSLIHLKDENRDFDLIVVQNAPPNLANLFSAKRYWRSAQLQTASTDKNVKDRGCRRLTARTYRCDRTVGQNAKFVSETLFWNAKNDLILMRTSSKKSFSEALAVTESVEILGTSRLPVGRSK